MTKPELTKALAIAKSEKELNDSNASIDIFDGYGLSCFKPVHVTIDQVARLIRWQCAYIGGGWDAKELDNLCHLAKKRFLIVG